MNHFIVELALDDAKETFLMEQLAYWYDQSEPTNPKRAWLENRLDRSSTDGEWDAYAAAFRRYLRRAMIKLDALWDDYVKRLEVDDFETEADVTQKCLGAMSRKP